VVSLTTWKLNTYTPWTVTKSLCVFESLRETFWLRPSALGRFTSTDYTNLHRQFFFSRGAAEAQRKTDDSSPFWGRAVSSYWKATRINVFRQGYRPYIELFTVKNRTIEFKKKIFRPLFGFYDDLAQVCAKWPQKTFLESYIVSERKGWICFKINLLL
jgi:hypothetical protein